MAAPSALLQLKQKGLAAAERVDRAAHDERVARQLRDAEARAVEPRERARRLQREAQAAAAAAVAAQEEADLLDPRAPAA